MQVLSILQAMQQFILLIEMSSLHPDPIGFRNDIFVLLDINKVGK